MLGEAPFTGMADFPAESSLRYSCDESAS
jgi:hypothetical protein